MKELKLNLEETKELQQYNSVEIVRDGFDILVEKDDDMECGYNITIINPYEKVVLTKESKGFKKGNWYKCKDAFGDTWTGVYMGREKGFECCVCENGRNAHCFNIYHKLDNDMYDYETFPFGTEHLPEILEDLGKSETILFND